MILIANKRLALNTEGQMTYCSAPEDKIGVGRCNHIEHQKDGESSKDFVDRVNETNKAPIEKEEFLNLEEKEYYDSNIETSKTQKEIEPIIKSQISKNVKGIDSDKVKVFLSESESGKRHLKTVNIEYEGKDISHNFDSVYDKNLSYQTIESGDGSHIEDLLTEYKEANPELKDDKNFDEEEFSIEAEEAVSKYQEEKEKSSIFVKEKWLGS